MWVTADEDAKIVEMANMSESEMSQHLERAGRVFTLAGKLGQEFHEEGMSRAAFFDPSTWERHAPVFEEYCEAILQRRQQIQHPPLGFEEVASHLKDAGRIARQIRCSFRSNGDDGTWSGGSLGSALGVKNPGAPKFTGYYEFFPDLNTVCQAGWDAIRRCNPSGHVDPFSFVDEPDDTPKDETGFTLLDRFPATPSGHVAFLEFVKIEIREQAEAIRQGKYSHESIEKQLKQGVKWEEAARRFSELSGLPDDLMRRVSEVLHRELSIGSVEQVNTLLEPVIHELRDFVETRRRAEHLDALGVVRREIEKWDSDNTPSESGYLVEPVLEGHSLHLAVAALQGFYGGVLPKPAVGHWRRFLRYSRSDDEKAINEADSLLSWVNDEVRKHHRPLGDKCVVVTVGDLWKALSEGRAPAVSVSAIALGPSFGPNIAQPRFPHASDQAKWDALERALALCDAEGGDRADAMRKRIAKVALALGVDRREVLNMDIANFVYADLATPVGDPLLNQLMWPTAADISLTKSFRQERHDPLVDRLRAYLESRLPTGTRLSNLQSLQDRGCDLLIEWSNGQKDGIQLKSNGDVEESEFAQKTVAQIQHSHQHGLRKLYLVFAADITRPSNSQKVRGMISTVSAMNDPYVTTVPPERALTLLLE